jgi:carbon-monoxide dehydrogenase medium subunit
MSGLGEDKMSSCRYDRPLVIEDAIRTLAAANGEAHVIAGGIALGILMNEKLVEPNWLIDVSRIEGLRGIALLKDGTLKVGALSTHREVQWSDAVRRTIPMLSEMAAEIACERIKNRGTIGGNICLADPQGDPPVAVLALRARLRAVGPNGPRDIPARSFFKDLYRTDLAQDEILQEIHFPPLPEHSGAAFGKFAARRAMDYSSTISAAVRVIVDPKSGAIIDLGLGMGGVGPTPVCPIATEQVLLGKKPDPAGLERLGSTVRDELAPISDDLYSADFKRHVASVILRRTMKRAYADACKAGDVGK